MKVAAAELRDQLRQLSQFVREVRAILNGGIRLADQLAGGVRTFRWLSTAAPVLLSYQGSSTPLGVLCLRVVESRSSRAVVTTGATVEWTHSDRGLLVSDIGGTTPGTEYDVTVAIVEG